MIDNIWPYVYLASGAALASLLILVHFFRSGADEVYKRLFLNIFILNSLQALAYLVVNNNLALAEALADAYLISFYFFFTHLLIVALYLSPKKCSYFLINSVYILPLFVAIMHLSGQMISGYRIEHNSLMHNDGEFAWFMDLNAAINLFATWVVLIANIKKAKERILKSKNILALICVGPFVLGTFFIVILSSTASATPVVVIIPIISMVTSFFFWYIARKTVLDLSRGIFNFIRNMYFIVKAAHAAQNKDGLKEISSELEKKLILQHLESSDSVTEAASSYGMSTSWMHAKMKEYGIERTPSGEIRLSRPQQSYNH